MDRNARIDALLRALDGDDPRVAVLDLLPDHASRTRVQAEIAAMLPEAARYDVRDDGKFWRLVGHALCLIDAEAGLDRPQVLREFAEMLLEASETGPGRAGPAQPGAGPAPAIAASGPAPVAPAPAPEGQGGNSSPDRPESPGSRPVAAPGIRAATPQPAPATGPAFTARTLFTAIVPGDPGFLPGLIGPPPPPGAPEARIQRWIAGEPEPDGLAIALRPDLAGRMALEIETEITADPEGLFSASGLFPRLPADPDPLATGFLAAEAGAADAAAREAAADALAASAERILACWKPKLPARLRGADAELRLGAALLDATVAALRIEAEFLAETGPDDAKIPENDLRGAIHPRCRLRTGLAVERALFLSLVAGYPVLESLERALEELRCAQVLRTAGPDREQAAWEGFHETFGRDFRTPLEGYRLDAKMKEDDLSLDAF